MQRPAVWIFLTLEGLQVNADGTCVTARKFMQLQNRYTCLASTQLDRHMCDVDRIVYQL